MKKAFLLPMLVIFFITACQPAQGIAPTSSPRQDSTNPPQLVSTLTPQPSLTVMPSLETRELTPTTQKSPASSPGPAQPSASDWMSLPVIPPISQKVVDIFEKGQKRGQRANAFSKVGDCGSTPSWFLGDFDRGPRFYNLGKYTYLAQVIEVYHGSFDRTSLAALAGFNTSSVLTPLWSNKEFCHADESPLACEVRIHQPSIAFITLGANDVYHLDTFESQLRTIIEYLIEQGVIPVLATKPDNIEGDHRINATIAALAIEYDIPLWNYWLAVQPLPNHGLQEDGTHITFASNDFSNPINLQAGWPIRNLTALQMLDAIYSRLNP